MRDLFLTVAVAMLLGSCSGDTTAPVTYHIAIVSGSNQIDTALATLPQPLIVRVNESTGRPAAGQIVDFLATEASGSVSAGGVTTDAQGFAQVRWTLGTKEGEAYVRASLQGSADVVIFGATVHPPTLRATAIAAGYDHTCAIAISHRLYCWGKNEFGQLGDGTVVSRNFAGVVPGSLLFDRVATGSAHTCGVTIAGELYCWGRNVWGQIGDGTMTTRLTPVRIAPDRVFADVVAGAEITCGLTGGGAVYCWGGMNGSQWQDYQYPSDVSGGIQFRSLSGSDYVVCGIGVDETPYCLVPTMVGDKMVWRPQPAPSPTYTRLAGGVDFMCGLDAAGAAGCWGSNTYGQLGIGTTTEVSGVVPVAGSHVFRDIYSGYDWTCGVTPPGATYCWGHNNWGVVVPVVGQRYVEPTPLLLAVPTGVTFVAMDGGYYHMCGLGTDTQVYCWGAGFYGQLGDGHPTQDFYNRPTLLPVVRR